MAEKFSFIVYANLKSSTTMCATLWGIKFLPYLIVVDSPRMNFSIFSAN